MLTETEPSCISSGLRMVGSSVKALPGHTNCATLIPVLPAPWTTEHSSVPNSTANSSEAGTTPGDRTREWRVRTLGSIGWRKPKKIRVHFHTRLYPKLALRKKINPCYWVARVKNRIPSSTDSPLIIHQSTPAPTLVFISFHEKFFQPFFFTLNARCFLSLVHWIVLLH